MNQRIWLYLSALIELTSHADSIWQINVKIYQWFDTTYQVEQGSISPSPPDWGSDHWAGVRAESPLIKMYGKLWFSAPVLPYMWQHLHFWWWRGGDVWLLLHHPCLALLMSCSALGKPALLGEKSYLFSYPALFTVFPEKKLSIMLNCTKLCVAGRYRSAACSRLKWILQKWALVLGLQMRTQTTFQCDLSKQCWILG